MTTLVGLTGEGERDEDLEERDLEDLDLEREPGRKK